MSTEAFFEWSHGSARVLATGAMLHDLEVRVGDRKVRPLAEPPWSPEDPSLMGLPGHLRCLGGEFVCLPFGSDEVPSSAPVEWRAAAKPLTAAPHGRSANEQWHLSSAPGRVVATMAGRAADPIAELTRTLAGAPARSRLDFRLDLLPSRDALLPIGLHPILALPNRGSAQIDASFEFGMVRPGRLPGSRLLPGSTFTDLRSVPGPDGPIDLSTLGAEDRCEEVVQLFEVRPPIRISYSEGWRSSLAWDVTVLPSVLLWHTDRWLTEAPWLGRYRGLGVEPVAAAFDFPPDVSAGSNPLSSWVPTAVALHAGSRVGIDYSLEVMI